MDNSIHDLLKEQYNARIDYDKKQHSTLDDRLNADMSNVHKRFNQASLLQYEGEYITATNSYKGSTEELQIKGRTLQNLYLPKKIIFGYAEINENRFTIDVSDIGHLKVTIKEDMDNYYYVNAGSIRDMPLKPNTKYTAYASTNIGIASIVMMDMDSTHLSSDVACFNKDGVAVFTTLNTINQTNVVFFYVKKANKGGNIEIKDITILEGDWTNKPIPYFEGIRSVAEEGESLVAKSCGKNLFDKNPNDFEQGTVYTSGLEGNSISYRIRQKKDKMTRCVPSKDYIIKTNSDYLQVGVHYYNEDKEWIGLYDGGWYSLNLFKTPANCCYLRILFRYNDDKDISPQDIKKYDIQLEKGTTATQYQPYQEDKSENLSCGKNLFDTSKIRLTEGFTISDNVVTLNAVKNEMASLITINNLKRGITYTLSANIIGDGYLGGQIINAEAGFSWVNSTNKIVRLSLKPDTTSITLLLKNLTGRGIITFSEIQLEEGTIATEYEPYRVEKPKVPLQDLRGLDDNICDILDMESGKLSRNVGKGVLDGSESDWTYLATRDTTIVFSKILSGKQYGDINMLCDRFKVMPQFTANEENLNGRTDGPSIVFEIFKSRLNGYSDSLTNEQLVTLFKNLLKQWNTEGNPLTVYYQLAEETVEIIEGVHQLRTQDGTTHFWTEGSLISPIINLKAPSNVQAVVQGLRSNVSTLSAEKFNLKNSVEENTLNSIKTNVNQEERLTILEMGVN